MEPAHTCLPDLFRHDRGDDELVLDDCEKPTKIEVDNDMAVVADLIPGPPDTDCMVSAMSGDVGTDAGMWASKVCATSPGHSRH